jgi:hypothetical protein
MSTAIVTVDGALEFGCLSYNTRLETMANLKKPWTCDILIYFCVSFQLPARQKICDVSVKVLSELSEKLKKKAQVSLTLKILHWF